MEATKTIKKMFKLARKEPVLYDAFLKTQNQEVFRKIKNVDRKICAYEKKRQEMIQGT